MANQKHKQNTNTNHKMQTIEFSDTFGSRDVEKCTSLWSPSTFRSKKNVEHPLPSPLSFGGSAVLWDLLVWPRIQEESLRGCLCTVLRRAFDIRRSRRVVVYFFGPSLLPFGGSTALKTYSLRGGKHSRSSYCRRSTKDVPDSLHRNRPSVSAQRLTA